MTKQRTPRPSTIGRNPFDTVIPPPANSEEQVVTPGPERTPANSNPFSGRRLKLTIHLDEKLGNRVKNAAYWNPRLTIAKIAEEGIRNVMQKIERENEGPYPDRLSELVGGRPIK